MKKCSCCKKILSISEFPRNKSIKSGYYYTCKKCTNKKNMEWAKKNPEKIRAKNKRRDMLSVSKYGLSVRTIARLGLNTALITYERAGRKCESCGSKNRLVIHHKDHNGRNNYDKGIKQNNNISNLIVLCRSCHSKYHSNKYWEKNKKAILKIEKNGTFIKEYSGVREASIDTGIKKAYIYSNVIGRCKSAGGFVWKYKTNSCIERRGARITFQAPSQY